MSDKVPKFGDADTSLWGNALGWLGLGFGVAYLVRMGYQLGINQAKMLIRRNDKQARKMERREKNIYKEFRKEKKREAKRNQRGP